MKRILLKIAVAAAALVLAVFTAEHAARWFDVWGVSYYADIETYKQEALELVPGGASAENHLFQNKPGVALLDLKTFEYRTDERRLRTHAEREAPADAMPVLFLGDSVTLGWGVDDEDTWVRRLEREATAPDGRPLDCLNFGHLMYDTVQEASLLRAFGAELAPELVILTFIYNDVHPTIDQLNELFAAPAPELEARPSALQRFADRRLPTLRKLARFREELGRLKSRDPREFPPLSYYPSGWPRCAAALDDVKRSCEALGARLVVNDHTWPEMPEVAAWCEANGVLCLKTALSGDDQRTYRNSVIDTHLNAEGNAVVAGLALEQLVAAGVLGARDSEGD